MHNGFLSGIVFLVNAILIKSKYKWRKQKTQNKINKPNIEHASCTDNFSCFHNWDTTMPMKAEVIVINAYMKLVVSQ